MQHWIQTSDWSDYDNKKKSKANRFEFICEEPWEVDFLVNKIRNFYPSLTKEDVRSVILECGETIKAPRSRSVFVLAVMDKLKRLINLNMHTLE